MKGQHLHFYWQSVIADKNRYRFYTLTAGPDLWGETCIIKRWGRIDRSLQERYIWPSSEADLQELLRKTAHDRMLHGYELVDAYF